MYVYVIGSDDGPQKIGISKSPKSRLAQLRTGHASNLTIRFAMDVPNAREVELHAHRIADNAHIRGEWFDTSASSAIAVVRAAIEECAMVDKYWSAAGGWSHRVGDRVVCRKRPCSSLPGPQPRVGHAYTISEVYETGAVDVAEITNDEFAFCPSTFFPMRRAEDGEPTSHSPNPSAQPPHQPETL